MTSNKFHYYLLLLISTLWMCTACEDVAEQYKEELHTIKIQNRNLQDNYALAISDEERAVVLQEARIHLLDLLTNTLFDYWYGTQWDMNGMTQIPQEGKIACGYFVSTVLRDAGFRVERIRLAQQPSENIVKTLCKNRKYIHRYRKNTPIQKFLDGVKTMGEGLYVVGLDTHVGFLLVDANNSYFIHAARTSDKQVKKEKASDSHVLKKSKYRIAGKLLPEYTDSLLFYWIEDLPVATKRYK